MRGPGTVLRVCGVWARGAVTAMLLPPNGIACGDWPVSLPVRAKLNVTWEAVGVIGQVPGARAVKLVSLRGVDLANGLSWSSHEVAMIRRSQDCPNNL